MSEHIKTLCKWKSLKKYIRMEQNHICSPAKSDQNGFLAPSGCSPLCAFMGTNKKKKNGKLSGTRDHPAGCGVHMRRQLNVGAERAETPITGCASQDSCIAAGLVSSPEQRSTSTTVCASTNKKRAKHS